MSIGKNKIANIDIITNWKPKKYDIDSSSFNLLKETINILLNVASKLCVAKKTMETAKVNCAYSYSDK